MAGFLYNSGWKNFKSIFVYNGGWKNVKAGWIYNGGWKQFFSSKFTIENTVTISQSTGSTGLVTLTGRNYHWTPNPTSLSYKFQWSSNGGSTWTDMISGTATNPATGSSNTYTYQVPSYYVTANTDNLYRFIVTATASGITTSDNSDTTTIGGPYDTTITITDVQTNQVSFSWTPSVYANRYITYYYNVNNSTYYYAQNGAGGTNGTTATITGLIKNTPYIFYVLPITGTSGSNLSNYYGYAGNTASAYQQTVYGYTVTYNANGGSNPPSDTTVYNYADLVTIKAQGSMTYGTKVFQSWNTSADGTGTSYNPSGAVYIYANITLYAQWLDFIYPPNQVGALTFTSGSSYINWTFTPSAVDSTHSPATTYAYTYNTTGTYPSNGGGLEINADVWAPNYTFAIQLLSPGSTYYGFIQPANTYNGTKQYAAWTRTKAMTTPPAPTYTYYYGVQNVARGGINIYGHATATSLSYTVYRTGTGTGTSGYGTGTYSYYDSGTFTKAEGATYFGTYYPAINGYYYIIAYQTNIGGDGSTSTSQISPQNWFWGPPPVPSGGTVSISTNTGNYSVGSIITYSTTGWTNSPYTNGYYLELHNGTNPVLTSDPLRASTTSSSGTYTITSSDVPNYFKAWATASNAGGTSAQAYSTQVGPAYTPVIPSAPTINSSSSTTTSITLNFTKGANSTSTRAYLNGSFDGSTNGTSYTFLGLSAGTGYTLALYGYDGTNMSSSYAGGTYYTSSAATAPSTPTGFTISGSGLASWTAVSGATGYYLNIWYASSASGANAYSAGVYYVSGGSTTSYQLPYGTNPSTGVYCNYADGQIAATNSAGTSAYSAWYPSATTYV